MTSRTDAGPTYASHAIVGSRTTAARDGRGVGVQVFRLGGVDRDPTAAAAWELVATWPATNPTFLIAGPQPTDSQSSALQSVYVVHGDADEVSRLTVERDGRITHRESRATQGANPVHMVLDATGRRLVVVNHSGSLVTLPVGVGGELGDVVARLDLEGTSGPHRTDQTRAKPHHVVALPDTDLLLVPDKGLDTVFTVRLDAASGALEVVHEVRLREGSGPRHLALHPGGEFAYTINELDSTVTALRVEAGGRLVPFEVHSSLDPRDPRDSRGAEIVLTADGTRLYASNRSGAGDHAPGGPGDDTVACFDVAADGRLTSRGWVRTGGIRPRFVTLEGESLLVANERSHTITRLDPRADGTLGPACVVARTGSPVCVLLL